jgi:origin recognition complex subunit 4
LIYFLLVHSTLQLVETILREIVKQAIVIRLSGHAQATDRHAMREIAYQLNHQTGSSFNLPEDQAEDIAPDGEENDHQYNFAPLAAYLPTLISQLPTLSRPVIVVLDAFDLFAQHPRQALLYCLLDTVQSCRAGAGRNGLLVVGMTTKVNCVNLLEKRVKSRFSQRVLRVPSLTGVDDVVQFVKTVLSLGLERLEPEEAMQEWNQIWTDNVQVCCDELWQETSRLTPKIAIPHAQRCSGHFTRVMWAA